MKRNNLPPKDILLILHKQMTTNKLLCHTYLHNCHKLSTLNNGKCGVEHASDAKRPEFELSIPDKKSQLSVSMTERYRYTLFREDKEL